MKKIISLLFALLCLALSVCALAADLAAPVAPAVPQQVSALAWFQQNLAYVLGAALSISELLGVTPWFKGNGLLDSVVKSLKYLASKTDQGQ